MSRNMFDFIKDMKTVGVTKDDPVKKVVEIAAPMGVVVAIIPTTNPTSTVIFKIMISLKARNAVVISVGELCGVYGFPVLVSLDNSRNAFINDTVMLDGAPAKQSIVKLLKIHIARSLFLFIADKH